MAQSVEGALIVRMEASLRKFERQMEAGRKSAVRAATGSERAWKRSGDQIAANANRAASGMGRFLNVSRGSRFVIQNTANQIGDMAVQLETGTSAFRVMGQQLPQVLGGLTALGGALGVLGPILGTVAAIGLPLAGILLSMGDDAEGAGEKAKTFADRLGDAEKAIRNAGAAAQLASAEGLENLGDMFGDVSEEVRELALELFNIEQRAASLKIGQIIDEVTASISAATVAASGAVDSALAQAGTDEARESAAEYRKEIERLDAAIKARQDAGFFVDPAEIQSIKEMRQELAAMEGDFKGLGTLSDSINLPPEVLSGLNEAQAALQAAQDASDFQGVADQLAVIRDLMRESGDTFSQDVVDGITLAEEQARLMAKALEDGKVAAQDIEDTDMGGAISGAVSEAVKLSNALSISLDTARKLAALGPQGAVSGETGGRGGDPRDFGGSFFDINNKEGTEFIKNSKPTRSKRGGGRKEKPGLFDAAEKQVQTLNRQIDMIGKTGSEVAELTAKYKLLDEAKKRGLDLDKEQVGTGETLRHEIDRQAEAIGDLTRAKETATEKAREMTRANQQMKDGFLDAIVEGENLSGVLESLAKSLARAALESAIFGGGIFGGGGLLSAIFPNADGNVISGGKVTPFASGGIVDGPTLFPMRGGTGLMGEAGSEAIMPLARVNGKLGVRADGGKAQPARVEVVARVENGSIVQDVRKIAGDVAVRTVKAGIQQYDRAQLPQSVSRINNDPRKRG